MREAHALAADEENPFSGRGAVLLDIGGDIGAIVVEMPADMVGVEIEVRPAGDDHHGAHRTHHPHVAVVERAAPGGTVPSLVFAELREGTYELTAKGGGPVQATVPVRGNEVTQVSWPGVGQPREEPDE